MRIDWISNPWFIQNPRIMIVKRIQELKIITIRLTHQN
jgi:hypothetical protein